MYKSDGIASEIVLTFGKGKHYTYSTDRTSKGAIPITQREYNEMVRLARNEHGLKSYMHDQGIFKRGYIL